MKPYFRIIKPEGARQSHRYWDGDRKAYDHAQEARVRAHARKIRNLFGGK